MLLVAGTVCPSRADLLLHPVRIRVIQVLAGRQLSTADIARELPDVPPATLYPQRHRLCEGGVVTVVARRRVRGTSQRIHTVSPDRTLLGAADLAGLGREDHRRLFTASVGSLLHAFQRYRAAGIPDLLADGVRYRQTPVYLDDGEYRAFIAELDAVVARAAALARNGIASLRYDKRGVDPHAPATCGPCRARSAWPATPQKLPPPSAR